MPPFGPGIRSQAGVPFIPNSVPAIGNFTDARSGMVFPHAYYISGSTLTAAGSPLPACSIALFRTADNSVAALTTSDGNGNYSIAASPALNHYAVAYLPGSPDVAGTTVNTLVGV